MWEKWAVTDSTSARRGRCFALVYLISRPECCLMPAEKESQSPIMPAHFYEQRSRVKAIMSTIQMSEFHHRDGSYFYCGSYRPDDGVGGNGGIFWD